MRSEKEIRERLTHLKRELETQPLDTNEYYVKWLKGRIGDLEWVLDEK